MEVHGHLEWLVKSRNGRFFWVDANSGRFNEPYFFDTYQDALKVQKEFGGEILSAKEQGFSYVDESKKVTEDVSIQDRVYNTISRRYNELSSLCSRLQCSPYFIYAEDYDNLKAVLDAYNGVKLGEDKKIIEDIDFKPELKSTAFPDRPYSEALLKLCKNGTLDLQFVINCFVTGLPEETVKKICQTNAIDSHMLNLNDIK